MPSTLPELLDERRVATASAVLAATRIGFVSAMAWTCGTQWDMGGHPKPDCYLVTVTSGAIEFGWDRLVRLGPGDLALAPTGAPLEGRLAAGCRRAGLLVVHAQLETDWGPSLPALAEAWHLALPRHRDWQHRLRQVVAVAGRDHAAARRFGDHVVAGLLVDLILEDRLRIRPPAEAFDPRIATALRAIRDDPRGELGSDDLAAISGLRPVRFRQLFRQALGVSPKRYQLDHRLDRAARRLRDGRERIGAIAEDLGFANQPYFQARFKQRFGCTPLTWRQQGAGL